MVVRETTGVVLTTVFLIVISYSILLQSDDTIVYTHVTKLVSLDSVNRVDDRTRTSQLVTSSQLDKLQAADWPVDMTRKIKPAKSPPQRNIGRNITCDHCANNYLAQVSKHDMHSIIQKTFHCVTTSMTPQTPVCVHDVSDDMFISRQILNDGTWEPIIVAQFREMLLSHPDIGVIDLGANIGVYTLIAAESHHDVIAVEPYRPNVERLIYAAHLAGTLRHITVYENGVSDSCGHAELQINPENLGDVRLKPSASTSSRRLKHRGVRSKHGLRTSSLADVVTNNPVRTITLGCLADRLNFSEAIVKIDIQGGEHRALQDFDSLFARTTVRYIIMEWSMLRDYYDTEIANSRDKSDVSDLIANLILKGFRAHSALTAKPLSTAHWFGWPDDVIWRLNEI